MESLSWMKDWLPVHLLSMAQVSECRFQDLLMSCPKRGDGVIDIEDAGVFTRLVEERAASILISMAALESYLGFYAYETSKRLEEREPGLTLKEYMEAHRLTEYIKYLPNKTKRRHEYLMNEYGDRPLQYFLTAAPLELYDKLMYWPMIRCLKHIDFREGYMKKLMRIISIRDEILHPDLASPPGEGGAGTREEIASVFLHHDLPAGLSPGKSCSDEYVREPYNEGHFFWEMLHCYPARAVQEAVEYIHLLDKSENHFISAVRPALMVDGGGNPVKEEEKVYTVEVRPGE